MKSIGTKNKKMKLKDRMQDHAKLHIEDHRCSCFFFLFGAFPRNNKARM